LPSVAWILNEKRLMGRAYGRMFGGLPVGRHHRYIRSSRAKTRDDIERSRDVLVERKAFSAALGMSGLSGN
jgi:hypothetical protein